MLKKITKHWKQVAMLSVVLIVLTGLVSKVYFKPGFPYTHDGENHLARFANYKIALKEGQFPPRFAPNLMNHYGYPVFNYNYPLANIASVPFSLIKLNYQLTFKILAVSSLAFGLLGLWLLLTKLKIKSTCAIVGGLTAFATAPVIASLYYHRGNIGEMMAISLLPWLFASLINTYSNKKHSWLNLAERFFYIFVWAAFFLSHNVSVLFGTAILLLFFIAQKPNLSVIKEKGLEFILGLGLSLWFWIPAIAEKSLIILDNANLSVGFSDHFITLKELLFSPFTFGFSQKGSIDGLSVGAGLAGLFAVLVVLFALLKQVNNKISLQKVNIHIVLFTTLSLLTLIFQFDFTKPIWNIVPFAQFIQFPWRLSLFFAISSSVLVAYTLDRLDSSALKILLAGLLFVQSFSLYNAKAVDYFNKNIIDYDLFSQSTSTLNENLPKDFTYQSFSATWSPKPSVLNDVPAEITVSSWTGTNREYSVSSTKNMTLIEPTMNFAGWETTISGDQNKKVTYVNSNDIGGRIAYELEPGSYTVKTVFTQNTPSRLIGNTISIVSLLLILGLTVKESLKLVHEK